MEQSTQEAPLSGRVHGSSRGWELAPALVWCSHSGSSWKALALPMCDSTSGQLTLAHGADGRAEPFWLVSAAEALVSLVSGSSSWQGHTAPLLSAHTPTSTPNTGSHACTTRISHRDMSPALLAPCHSWSGAGGLVSPYSSQHSLASVVAVLVWWKQPLRDVLCFLCDC